MFVHESVAKAKLRGALRVSEFKKEEILHSFRDFMCKKQKCRLSKADAQRYVKDSRDFFGEMLIGEFTKVKNGSWHFQSETYFVEPRLYELDNYGLVTPFVVNFFDSRHFLKRKAGYSRIISSLFLFHQHFLVRALQRLELETIGDVGKKFHPIIKWCVHKSVPFKHLPEFPHFVMRDCVVVCHKLPEKGGMLFKTILMKKMMNKNQLEKFGKAFDKLESKKIESVLVNHTGDILRSVISTKENESIRTHVGKSVWFAN
ncbi:hypothetical protein [Shewanella youngdeokensis]|uniref:Uncharacterized protein n=1 Tax=Shewanella youngdeokensis TaxID=2999068 RepID=A0ABZ0K0L9_9GAMM|nr:hypothetical protein RGE70_00750 [Shewanella sp. DAU334]